MGSDGAVWPPSREPFFLLAGPGLQPMSYNGAAVVAMAGKNCVAIAR